MLELCSGRESQDSDAEVCLDRASCERYVRNVRGYPSSLTPAHWMCRGTREHFVAVYRPAGGLVWRDGDPLNRG